MPIHVSDYQIQGTTPPLYQSVDCTAPSIVKDHPNESNPAFANEAEDITTEYNEDSFHSKTDNNDLDHVIVERPAFSRNANVV